MALNIKKPDSGTRTGRREIKRVNLFLRTLVITFLEFRLTVEDKEGQAVTDKFDALNKKWIAACNADWVKIKTIDRHAFEKQVDRIIKTESLPKLKLEIND